MGFRSESGASRIVVDAIRGDIRLEDREWRILDTMAFQRLRSLKQLGMGQITYPNATHTRFAHSLGTLGIMGRILDVAQANRFHLSKSSRANLRMAALLHDIGHYPYSHLMERVGAVELTEETVQRSDPGGAKTKEFLPAQTGYPSHEEVGIEIVTHQEDLVRAIGGRARAMAVAQLFARTEAADAQLSKLLHSSFDMDRVDYLQRDSLAAGVPYGNIDVNYLLNSLRISPSGMVGVSEKALPAAEQFLLARFFMHQAVYYHKTTFGMEEACRQLLRRIRDAGKFEMPSGKEAIFKIARSPLLASFTDAYVDSLVRLASQDEHIVIRTLGECILRRRPPKLLKEVLVLRPDDQQHHAATTFRMRAKASLRALAEKHSLPLGLLILCRTRPLRLEPRGPKMTRQQAQSLPSEQRDEMIMVFTPDSEEPKPLVEIDHSLISVCAGHFWQAHRLYVALPDDAQSDLVDSLRNEVRHWDQPE